MKYGGMFAALDGYKRKSFWQEHQYFTFDTIYEEHTYQVIAAFKTSANLGQGFAYHTFNYAESEEEFNKFISTVRSLLMYHTGVTAEYGDMLLTLSTCEYTLDNGRFVVIAKRVS
jgi:sortase B